MSQYFCQNTSCAIAISKATFPISMNCPVCLLPLTEKKDTLSEVDENLIASLPYLIAYPLKRTLLEKHAWTKINLLKDTFLNYLKYFGLLTASEFFNSPLKDRKIVALFQQTLSEPSFGSWNQYIRETLQYLNEHNHSFFCEELVNCYERVESGGKRKLYKGEIQFIDGNGDVQLKKQEATAIGMLINFRNRYLGHGLTLDEADSQKLWDEYFPIFRHLLEQMDFTEHYPMYKCEHGESYQLKSAELVNVEKGQQPAARVWIENPKGGSMDILPFFVVPGEVSLTKEDKEQILAYESYTGKTIKFFSPEGTEKQTSGKILEQLNLLLRDKQKEQPYTPDSFTKEVFLNRIAEENKLILDSLIDEKKVIQGVYVHREEMEIKLREWIGARANIFFIAAEAGSGKTNLLVEIQRQYLERNLPSLLIRASRMEKQSLKEQIAYLLNLDNDPELNVYTSISGTQAEPTFILIDGLNEANNAEDIWKEVLELSKIFIRGSLKFVITSRANSKADVERFVLEEKNEIFLYGENKDSEKGLGAFVHWLTPLNMVEMKTAWNDYVKKDKNKFKPLFTFDDLATFDRALYNHISNPLLLRLFLETYHGKKLPTKGNQHLNIWKDWLDTFSEEEQIFMKLLANEVWKKGKNELILDDLLKQEQLKEYFNTDLINAPYHRLKNLGWISRYLKDMTINLAFTVEGAMLFLLGSLLNNEKPSIDLNYIQNILKENNPFKKSAVEAFLSKQAINGDISLIIDLIDFDKSAQLYCIRPLQLYMQVFGVFKTTKALTRYEDGNLKKNIDWKLLLELDYNLEQLQLHDLRKDFLGEVAPLPIIVLEEYILLKWRANELYGVEHNYEFWFGDFSDIILKHFDKNENLLFELAKYKNRCYKFDESLEILNISLISIHDRCGVEHLKSSKILDEIGFVWSKKGDNLKALDYFNKSLLIREKNLGSGHLDCANSYRNLGLVCESKGDMENAWKYFNKCLEIEVKFLGEMHPSTAATLDNIGKILSIEHQLDKALEFYQKSLNIRLKTLGNFHSQVEKSYYNIGSVLYKKCCYQEALYYYNKSLEINLSRRKDILFIEYLYFDIGLCHKNIKDFSSAINSLISGYKLSRRGGFPYHIAECYEALNDKESAFQYFLESAEIRKDSIGKEHESTQNSIDSAKRLAKALGKEGELPEWMG